MTQNDLFPKSKLYTVLVPYSNIAAIMDTYLKQVGAVDPDRTLTYMQIPLRVNDEGLVEITIGFDELN